MWDGVYKEIEVILTPQISYWIITLAIKLYIVIPICQYTESNILNMVKKIANRNY